MTIAIIRHTRCRSYDAKNMIDSASAFRVVLHHFNRNDSNYVEIEGKLCFTVHQADKAITSHFAKEPA